MNKSIYRSRLTKEFDEKTAAFVSSLDEDMWILQEDIEGTEAHDIMLAEQKILSKNELTTILKALEKLRAEILNGKIRLIGKSEDVHEFIEAQIIEQIGITVGGKLHSGRSRNDQVAVDIRMKIRKEINHVSQQILILISTLLTKSQEERDTLTPLYTHTQQAQLGVYSHYLNSYIKILLRDFQRLNECYQRVNLNPLGACAVGGTRFPIDRTRTAELLGFDGLAYNSLDAVSSRDFILETASILAILMSNLSRIAEDIILWSTSEFGYIEIADEYSSTSSVMPQKKNPCTIELIRGKTGKTYGSLINLLTIVKGLPSGYNRDLQEMKVPLRESFDVVGASLEILSGVIKTLIVNKQRLKDLIEHGFMAALDLAETLVASCGLSFREAHTLVGRLVLKCIQEKSPFTSVTSDNVKSLSKELLGKEVTIDIKLLKKALYPETSLIGKRSAGSPSPFEINKVIKNLSQEIHRSEQILKTREAKLLKARHNLTLLINKYVHK